MDSSKDLQMNDLAGCCWPDEFEEILTNEQKLSPSKSEFVSFSLGMSPIEMDDILSKLFQYLDFSSLRHVRLVGLDPWTIVATKEMFRRGFIVVPRHFHYPTEWFRKKEKIDILLKFGKYLTQHSIQVKNVLIRHLDDVKILKNCSLLGSSTTTLDWRLEGRIDLKGPKESFKLLTTILRLDNLESLTTNCFDICPRDKSHVVLEFLDRAVNGVLFINKIKSLNEFRLSLPTTTHETTFLLTLEDCPDSLRNVCLSFKITPFFVSNNYINVSPLIDTITVCIESSFDLDGTRAFLNRWAGSLRKLYIYFLSPSSISFDIKLKEVCTDNWFIPLSLTKLETLSIQEHCGNFFDPEKNNHHDKVRKSATWRSIITALQLPRLTRLDFDSFYAGPLNKIEKFWNESKTQDPENCDKNLQSESIKQLGILCGACSDDYNSVLSDILQPGSLWPRVEKVDMFVSTLTVSRKTDVYRWRRAEAQSIDNHYMFSDPNRTVYNWDYLLIRMLDESSGFGFDTKSSRHYRLKENFKLDSRRVNKRGVVVIINSGCEEYPMSAILPASHIPFVSQRPRPFLTTHLRALLVIMFVIALIVFGILFIFF